MGHQRRQDKTAALLGNGADMLRNTAGLRKGLGTVRKQMEDLDRDLMVNCALDSACKICEYVFKQTAHQLDPVAARRAVETVCKIEEQIRDCRIVVERNLLHIDEVKARSRRKMHENVLEAQAKVNEAKAAIAASDAAMRDLLRSSKEQVQKHVDYHDQVRTL